MRYKAGTIFMIVGILLMVGAAGLFVSNQQDAAKAEQAVDEFLPQLIAEIQRNEQELVSGGNLAQFEQDTGSVSSQPQNNDPADTENLQSDSEMTVDSSQEQQPTGGSSAQYHTTSSPQMTEVVIKTYSYIGYLTIPKLGLELPIMTDWSYQLLKIAPCRYSGTVMGDDLVLMAHNYARHFGKLSSLREGDEVYFTDALGITTRYQVVGRDVLIPTAVEEMTSGEFDLTLFTCTYGGQSRVTVYCDRVVE